MKKAILVRFDDNGNLKIVVSGKKYIPGVNLCKCCYVKVRNKSEKYSDMFNLALDIKHEENENTEKSLPEADLDFLFGPDCDYDIWILKELVDKTFYSKEGKEPFTLTNKDVKTVEELLELISTTEIDRTNRDMKLSNFLKTGDDFFEKMLGFKLPEKEPKPKTGNEDVDKMVIDIFGLKNPMDILTLENKDNDKAFFKMMSSEDGVKKVLDLANLVKTKLEGKKFVNKDDVWSKAMKKRTEDLIEILSKKSDDIKKETEIEDPKDVMLKQLCKTLGVDYDKYKEFENIMYNILGLSGKIAGIKNSVKNGKLLRLYGKIPIGSLTRLFEQTVVIDYKDNNLILISDEDFQPESELEQLDYFDVFGIKVTVGNYIILPNYGKGIEAFKNIKISKRAVDQIMKEFDITFKEFKEEIFNLKPSVSTKYYDKEIMEDSSEIKDKKSPSFDLTPFTEILCKMFGTDPEKYKEFKMKLETDGLPGLGEHKHIGIGEEELSKVELKPFTGRPRGGARCVMSQQQPFMRFGEIKSEDVTSILKPFEEVTPERKNMKKAAEDMINNLTTPKDITSINKINVVLDITDVYGTISIITAIPNYKTFPKEIFKFDMKINKTARKLIAFCQSIVSPYFASYAKYYFTGEFLEFMKSGQLKDLNIPLEELNKLKFKSVEREDKKPLENSKPDIKPSKGITFQDVLINITKDGKLEVVKEFDKKDVYQILHTNRIHTLVKFFRYLESNTNCINVKMYFTEDTVKHFNQTEEFKNIEFGKVIS